jgi:Fe-Mn family superoxide dismutase
MSMRLAALKETKEKLILTELPYGYSDLEPVMSRTTIQLHYDILSRGYVDRFNGGEGDPAFNRAGAMLHNLFWSQLRAPAAYNDPKGVSLMLIVKQHDSFAAFRDRLCEEATKFQGSGWLYLSKAGKIGTLVNQSWKDDIIMPIDIWEHAYLLDHGADRKKYIRGLLRCINWNIIDDRINMSS